MKIKIKNIFFLCFTITIISCNKTSIEGGVKLKKSDKNNNIAKNIIIRNDSAKTEELAYLFFRKENFDNNQKIDKINTDNQKQNLLQKENIKPEDLKILVDWKEDGKRKIKIKNLKNNKEYIIVEGVSNSEITLEERTLFYYKFKIYNETIIKVKR